MHVTGLAEVLIEALRKVQAERSEPIRVVRLQVGELGGISPEHLAEHFYEAATGTEFEHVKLETDVRGVMATCADCGAAIELSDELEACPDCGSRSLAVQADDAVRLVSVEERLTICGWILTPREVSPAARRDSTCRPRRRPSDRRVRDEVRRSTTWGLRTG